MTLTRALSSAHSGLVTTSFRAEVAAGNVANASTPGYVRREAISGERVVGGQGNGVSITGVERHQDLAQTRLRREADASLGRASLMANVYSQLNSQIGTPESEIGLFASYQDLESVLQEFSATPESPALQASVLQASTALVDQLNSLSKLSTSLREAADRDIAQSVSLVNESLYKIQDLNGAIANGNSSTGETAALEDERQKLIDTISEIIPVKDLIRQDSRVEIMTTEGVFLLGTEVHEVEFQSAAAINPDIAFGDGTNRLSGLMVGDQELTPGTGKNFAVTSGTLSGYFTTRDTIVPSFNAQIDSIAADLIDRFSDDTLDPTKVAGAPGIFTDNGNPLDPLDTVGIAGRIKINAAVDPAQGGAITRFRDGIGALTVGPSGDADIINNYLEALNAANPAPGGSGVQGNYSFSELLAGVTSVVGENRIRHEAISSSAAARQTLLADAELKSSGVDTDFELQSLLLVEQAYAANARIVQVVSDMLDRLMQI